MDAPRDIELDVGLHALFREVLDVVHILHGLFGHGLEGLGNVLDLVVRRELEGFDTVPVIDRERTHPARHHRDRVEEVALHDSELDAEYHEKRHRKGCENRNRAFDHPKILPFDRIACACEHLPASVRHQAHPVEVVAHLVVVLDGLPDGLTLEGLELDLTELRRHDRAIAPDSRDDGVGHIIGRDTGTVGERVVIEIALVGIQVCHLVFLADAPQDLAELIVAVGVTRIDVSVLRIGEYGRGRLCGSHTILVSPTVLVPTKIPEGHDRQQDHDYEQRHGERRHNTGFYRVEHKV